METYKHPKHGDTASHVRERGFEVKFNPKTCHGRKYFIHLWLNNARTRKVPGKKLEENLFKHSSYRQRVNCSFLSYTKLEKLWSFIYQIYEFLYLECVMDTNLPNKRIYAHITCIFIVFTEIHQKAISYSNFLFSISSRSYGSKELTVGSSWTIYPPQDFTISSRQSSGYPPQISGMRVFSSSEKN